MSTENLHSQEAIDKLKKLVDKIDIGMLCSNINSGHLHAVPMSRQEVDEEGNIWFLFSSESDTYQHIQHDNKVSLLYSDIKDYNFLSINGTAEVSRDTARIDKYWNKMIEAWFEKGKEDPRIRVLRVTPSEAHYWDNKTNKLVTFFKVALSAVSDQKMDVGRKGDLNF
ncbi:pyridoxamine 5'-phosphate oxidase family protein [Chitinophaga pendula]|uniref:pyridoxamine 5'-phosphate oxidase family protein n=1 Tax=Chitinophaga TaxID=79328 RepID=UPI000BAFAD68|nr:MULTISPECIES: pyridoxamine 5'-phosphate oxidase family protein [Chitinophaga]ASZ13489.1 general stress protein [Chitinophaga sp. MD30]UCJ08881.1 pyridoxamine 5'-phosphate oxidase family protein [Chitinophaga pendula]